MSHLPEKTSTDTVRFMLRLTSRDDTSRTVVLEPWTGEYRLPPGVPLDIAVEGTPTTPLEIEFDGDHIIVSAFDSGDCELTAYRAGKELRSEHGSAASEAGPDAAT